MSINAVGQLAFVAQFTDGSTGVFVSNLVADLTVPGDFDSDGDVDGADFVIWQTNFPAAGGHTPATGDADGDGDVDGADFVVWQTHFPTSPAGGIVPVPEPPAYFLGLLFGGLLMVKARRVH